MKKLNNYSWIAILGSVLLISALLRFIPRDPGNMATVLINGQVYMEIPLDTNASYPIVTGYGSNTLTVRDGMIAVTEADCPGHDCVQMGYRSEGEPIVCLPHNLVITFDGGSQVDSISG